MILKLIDFHGTDREDDHSLSWGKAHEGRAVIHFLKSEMSCDESYSRVKFTGFDPSGECVFGPLVQMALPAIRLEDVPAHVVRLRVEYLKGQDVVCIESVAVSLQADETTVLGGGSSQFEKMLARVAEAKPAPAKAELTLTKVFSYPEAAEEKTLVSLELRPSTATLSPGGNLDYKVLGVYEDGSKEDVTQDAVWSTDCEEVAVTRFEEGGRASVLRSKTPLPYQATVRACVDHLSVEGLLRIQQHCLVTDYLSSTVNIYNIDQQGAFQTRTEIETGAGPSAVATHPTGLSFYVTNSLSDSVSVFGFSTDQRVVLKQSIRSGKCPDSITLTPDGRHCYVSNTLDHSVSLYSVMEDFTLKPVCCIDTEGTPSSLVFHPGGCFAYLIDQDKGGVSTFRVYSDGRLALYSEVRTEQRPVSIAVGPDGEYLFVADVGGVIYSYRIGELGGLRRVDSREVGGHLNSVAFHPRLRTAYFADSRNHRIVKLGFDSDGRFSGEPESTACPGARSLAMSGAGDTLFSLNSLGGSLAKYEVKDDGRLVCQQALSWGGTPLSLVLTP